MDSDTEGARSGDTRGDGHLHAEERGLELSWPHGLGGNQPCRHLDLGLAASSRPAGGDLVALPLLTDTPSTHCGRWGCVPLLSPRNTGTHENFP